MPYPITLREGMTNATVAAVLVEALADAELREIESQWGTARRDGHDRLRRAGRNDLVHHAHWTWDNPHKLDGVARHKYDVFGVRVGTEWQGAMSLYAEPTEARLWPLWRKALKWASGFGTYPKVVYVDYVETAPWN